MLSEIDAVPPSQRLAEEGNMRVRAALSADEAQQA